MPSCFTVLLVSCLISIRIVDAGIQQESGTLRVCFDRWSNVSWTHNEPHIFRCQQHIYALLFGPFGVDNAYSGNGFCLITFISTN